MTDTDNAYRAKGTSPHEAFDFIAYPGEKKTWAPTWGFVTCFKEPGTSVKGIKDVFLNGDSPLFRFGGSFGGWVYGVAAHGGSPDASGKVGPDVVANYSDFAGVFGTGVYVEGVAGTSVLHCGVYGQTGEIPTRDVRSCHRTSWPAFSALRPLCRAPLGGASLVGRHTAP